jgi:hypothetical protein
MAAAARRFIDVGIFRKPTDMQKNFGEATPA